MRKTWLIAGLVILIAGAAVYAHFTQLKIVNDWAQYDERPIVLKNKVWKVSFSKKIAEASLDGNQIYVTDDQGKKQEVDVELGPDGQTVYISPPDQGYDSNIPFYTLNILDGIKTKSGRKLSSGKQLSFVVNKTLPVIGSKEKLDDYFKKAIKTEKNHRQTVAFDATKENATLSADSAKTESSAKSVSETNVQVAGIDEADTVKTDGKHIYQISDGKVRIIEAIPANKMILKKVLEYDSSFMPSQLYVEDQHLVIIGPSYQQMPRLPKSQTSADLSIVPMYQSTKLIIYNIEDPQNPAKLRELEMEGSYVSSRKRNGIVYLIASHYPDYWALEQGKKIDLRPRYRDTAVSEKPVSIDYDQIHYFSDSAETNYNTIAAIDLSDPLKDAAMTTYLGSGQELYMSNGYLYLAVPNYTSIERDRSSILSPDTTIYKFSVEGMNVAFHSSAEIEGTILNQFAMDEYEGNLRVATTKDNSWNEERPSANHLYIFDVNLQRIGELKDLARGERIYSTRFMGERIYIVTFKQVDPLFVIDAANPKTPKVLGELKIPGFSNYLHPYDENHIIGFGQDTELVKGFTSTTEPRVTTKGVKISLFDVSDVASPKEKFTEIIGGSGTYSPLNHDHKALLYDRGKNLFAFPITVYSDIEGKEVAQNYEFQGAYVYHIDSTNGFSLKSKITHSFYKQVYEEWSNSIERLVYIDNSLYALSPSKITAHDLQTFNLQGELVLNQ
ncbi:beta-propeller domain-containing protein [Bacillus sp. V33-4]|uniref:beta-propeller domain-containing protein n=1 Tax=Bacillus sp. V33-4 TaxID=2054169 RepID=UPI0015E066FC|nr:beta-propeller domain-containing protein [Bacillus sp. V33-4]